MSEYQQLTEFVYDQCGIRLGAEKESLVTARLSTRMRLTKCADLAGYMKHVEKNHDELVQFLDAITTNTTSFFREPNAFTAADNMVRASLKSAKGTMKLRFWSAACSLGMEAYTLAMLLAENGATKHDTAILCTDISSRAMTACQQGIYDAQAIAPIPDALRSRYLTQLDEKRWQVNEPLRKLITVNRVNLSKPPFPMRGPFDAIFCRNVMIYFDKPVRQRLISACHQLIRPGGLLLIGAAESLHGLDHSFTSEKPAIYRK
jgi:chemotaxis protein methyltransferase CheR